ncbi:MAG TPA: hypothetical protein EYP57_02985 [Thermodesulfobacteriaceae bacterium]|nr:hypothetical protein [Thermodesulfobacteriaceae bacterium]
MKKKILSTCLALFFSMSVAGVSMAGTKCKGTVVKIDGNNLIIDCGKKACKFKEGDAVKVKKTKAKAVEGC